MKEFLNEYHLAGLFIGICTFLIIGLFHPVVVKAEYYWGTKCWWIFLVLGIAGVIASLSIDLIFFIRRVCVFFLLDDQRGFRTGRTGTKRMVPQESEAQI